MVTQALFYSVPRRKGEQTDVDMAPLFGIATFGGQVLLRRYYRALLERDVRHRVLLRFWGILYAFVGIQMGWVLRPFIGDPYKPVVFFREDSWGNAYVVIFQLLRQVFL